MKIRKIMALVLGVLILLSLVGCGNEPAFSMGKTTGTTYTNDFLGLSCTLPQGWTFASEQELLQLNNMTKEYLDEDTLKLLEKATIVYDMSAQHLTEGGSINVNMEKFTSAQIIKMNVKATLEAQIPTLISTYENMGFTDVIAEVDTIAVDGQAFDGVRISANYYGDTFYLICISFKRSTYLANVAIGAWSIEKLEETKGCFTVK